MRVLVGATAVRDFTAGELTGAVITGWRAAAADELEAFALSDGATGLGESLAAAKGPGSAAAVVETGHLLTGSTTAPVARALVSAVDAGADRVVLGMAASRAHDGGQGFAEVIRERFGSLAAAREALAAVDVVVVGNDRLPLLGLHGAGARLADEIGPDEAQRRDREVAAFASAVGAELELPRRPAPRLATAAFTGLGGGSAFVALALGARATSGAEYTVTASGMAAAVPRADLCLVVVEEMDAVALEESAAAALAPAALEAGCPVVVLSGEDHTSRHQRAALGIVGSYTTGGPLDPDALAVRVLRVARTWTR